MNEKELQNSGYEAVIRLFKDNPEWIPVVLAASEEASERKTGAGFAGAWVLKRAKKHGVQWVPNLRKLVAYGILQKDGESSRGGRRAYYSMPDLEGVQKALQEINVKDTPKPYTSIGVGDAGLFTRPTVKVPLYTNLASCGSPNDTEAGVEEYVEVDTKLARPGHNYYLVRADGDSMNLAGIDSGDLVLVREQNYADIGQKVVACLEDGVTIKEFQRKGDFVVLMPRSDNPDYKPTLLADGNVQIQGVVVAAIPNFK